MTRVRILVTVKTYPTLSRKYRETVCTAGLRPEGSWVRIYPVPFRRLGEQEQYKKYDWLECDLVRNTNDSRRETFRPADVTQLLPVGHLDTHDNWRDRRRLILQTATVHTRMQALSDGARANAFSLAVFKPTRILDFIWEEEDREWDQSKVDQMRSRTRQGVLLRKMPGGKPSN